MPAGIIAPSGHLIPYLFGLCSNFLDQFSRCFFFSTFHIEYPSVPPRFCFTIQLKWREKRNLTKSCDKCPFTIRKLKSRDNTKTLLKLGLHNDCRPYYISAFHGLTYQRTIQIIRYRATATLRRPSIKHSIKRGVGLQNQREHHIILTK